MQSKKGNMKTQTKIRIKKKEQNRTEANLKTKQGHLVATAGFAGAWSPINDDETKTHYHKQEADSSKTGSLEEKSDWIH